VVTQVVRVVRAVRAVIATAKTPLNSVARLLSPSLGVGSTTVTTRPAHTSVRRRGASAPTTVVGSALTSMVATLPNRLRKNL
jgi:hypothetical protein